MIDHRIRVACGFILVAAALFLGSNAHAQTFFLSFSGAPGSITCTTTSLTAAPGLMANWSLTPSTQIVTTITAQGVVVKQNAKPISSAMGSLALDGDVNYSTQVTMPYTVVYALTPSTFGAPSSAISFDCVNGMGTNFKILNGPSFAASSLIGNLENPQVGSPQSGIGLVSGWSCSPTTSIQVSFDGAAKIPVPYGSPRADTASVCGSQINTGFGLLFNYNNLGPGVHTVAAYANDTTLIGSVPFVVNTLGVEFLTGVQATININNFPTTGKQATLAWQQATQNFSIASTAGTPASVTGNYLGALTGTATGCGASSGTFAIGNVQFALNQSGDALTMMVTIPGNTPSSCTLNGTMVYNVASAQHMVANGNYNCNDGTSGMWSMSGLAVNGGGFTGASTLTATTGCISRVRHAAARMN